LEKTDFRRHVYLNAHGFFAACADFDAGADADAPSPFAPEPPGSWQDARVAATPMALMAAMIRFEAVIMMEPPLLSIRPR